MDLLTCIVIPLRDSLAALQPAACTIHASCQCLCYSCYFCGISLQWWRHEIPRYIGITVFPWRYTIVGHFLTPRTPIRLVSPRVDCASVTLIISAIQDVAENVSLRLYDRRTKFILKWMPEMLHATVIATVRGDAILFLEFFTFIISCVTPLLMLWMRLKQEAT